MVPRGLEPRTLRLLAVRSDQLSYETSMQNGLVPALNVREALMNGQTEIQKEPIATVSYLKPSL